MFQGVQFTSDCQEHTRHTLRQSLGSTLDGTEKEKPCLGNKQDNKKESSPCVEKSSSVLTLHMEKENHNSDGDKPVEVIPKVKVVKLPKQPLFGIKFRKESSCAPQSCELICWSTPCCQLVVGIMPTQVESLLLLYLPCSGLRKLIG